MKVSTTLANTTYFGDGGSPAAGSSGAVADADDSGAGSGTAGGGCPAGAATRGTCTSIGFILFQCKLKQ